MGALLVGLVLGLVLGLVVGIVLGRRAATPPGLRSPAPVAGRLGDPRARASSPSVPPPSAPAPMGSPNKRARKAGLTEDDFRPSDDILERMRHAWEAGAEITVDGALGEAAPTPESVVPVNAEVAPEPAPGADAALDETTRRVLERLGSPPGGKETAMADEPTRSSPPHATATVTEMLASLEADGYGDDLRFDHGQVRCGRCGEIHDTEGIEVDRVLRHEGPSDPADETIVFALRCPRCGAKGALVSSFGFDADPALADAFVYWSAKARHS